jgi:hypothetical protein
MHRRSDAFRAVVKVLHCSGGRPGNSNVGPKPGIFPFIQNEEGNSRGARFQNGYQAAAIALLAACLEVGIGSVRFGGCEQFIGSQ